MKKIEMIKIIHLNHYGIIYGKKHQILKFIKRV